MNLRNIVAIGAFAVPVLMSVLVAVVYALDAAEAVTAVLGSLAGVSFGALALRRRAVAVTSLMRWAMPAALFSTGKEALRTSP